MKSNTLYVVLGMASDGKPHASKFSEAEAGPATKAASLMGYRIGKAESEKARAAAGGLPVGKIFETGRGLVPLVKADLYDQLNASLSFEPASKLMANNPAQAGKAVGDTAPADPWAAIKVGGLVLAFDKTNNEGWWEAVVLAVSKDGGTLTLRWRDWPSLKKFTVARRAVSIVPALKP